MRKMLYGFLTLLLIAICSHVVLSDDATTFRLVLLPDTQGYSANHPDIYKAQTQWVVDHVSDDQAGDDQAGDIAFVLHLGDITNNNSAKQWEVAVAAMQILDGKVPYTITHGNHDIGKGGSSDVRDTALLNKIFPYEQHAEQKGFGGAYETGKVDNTWHTFNAGGLDWLIISLEFGPRNCVIDWAKKIVEDHPKHKVIINTHAYMYSDETRMGEGDKWLPKQYGLGKETDENAVNDGEQIWEKLVSHYPNIMFVFSGHVLNDGTGLLISQGANGKNVYQMLANYQGGVIGSVNGGNGFLRIITIDTKNKTIDVKSYSPYTKEFKTEPDQQFQIENVEF